MMKRILLSSSVLLALSTPAMANLKSDWEKILNNYNMSPQYHSFCYSNEAGQAQGSNPHMKVRLASVSKLITSYWASESLGADYQYKSEFYLDGKHLHIAGDKDPIYSKRKLFFLLSQLNNLGIHELDKITFDSNLIVFSKAEEYTGDILRMTSARTAANLKDFFHTPDWNKLKVAYRDFIKSTPKEVIDHLQIREELDDLDLSVKSVQVVKENPLKDVSEAKKMIHLSPEIIKYLKAMNIQSNNFIADQVFNKLGGESEFDKFIAPKLKEWLPNLDIDRENFSANELSIKLYSGSGLPEYKSSQRLDNYATCSIIVKIIEELDKSLDLAGKSLQQMVAVSGSDIDKSGPTKSTIRARFLSPKVKNSLVVKTGTLFHTSTLAGKVSTQQGSKYFGVFHQLRGWKGHAKASQDEIVKKIVDSYGGAEKLEYQKEFFFPAHEVLR
ncbi:putative D-alanyl-D-alanine carboxypeptidase precursor [Halobacteriovorax marinus SJ]|uniref:D-alanyl-D-alanine carboxypeptidase n=1 Tax=Halobacteriovorax marinus (strain ATCC BAA-682 / DSM 15412 / SJ) TaxID=862908 RepID=E1X3I3_HALMS|nr:D-alanyl-D-alanine carboxypeptidase [Halobacteriovorax marinus]CBW26912.1 putative D-alanyl-D-alanine carboxypeptidase precursor [Halobacteriovorax marinus SJ]